MSPILDLALTFFAATSVLGLAGAGVLALPWSDREVNESWAAWSAVSAVPARWMRGEAPVLMVVSADDLLPDALPRALPEFSRARRLGHVASCDGSDAWHAPICH
jgi:hypothetical protein